MPKFSICIPTRERDVTLRSSIETVLAQTNPDFELIVQDNCSSAATADVVKSFDDPRLRYFRSDRRLPMHDNWEAALQQTTGDYVIFIGDDDALMPDCLARIEPLLKSFDPDVLGWLAHTYYWPDCPDAAHRNLLMADIRNGPIWREGFADDPFGANVSYRYPGRPPGTLVFDGRSLAKGWYGWRGIRPYVPIYHNVVARRLIDRVRARAGRYFLDPTPDFASLAANVYFADKILYYTRALSMSGHSGVSNGGMHGEPESLDRAWDRFVSEAGLTLADIMPHGLRPLKWEPSLLLGCFENVRRHAFPEDPEFPRATTDFIRYAATQVGYPHAESRDRCCEWVRELAVQFAVPAGELNFSEPMPFVRPSGIQHDHTGRVFYINIDGNSAGLRTIADAVRLASNFSLQADHPVDVPPQAAAETASVVAPGAKRGIDSVKIVDRPFGGLTLRGAPLTARRILQAIGRRIRPQ